MSLELIVPVVTPLNENLTLDITGAENLVRFLKKGGVSGIFVGGSTGEFASLPDKVKIETIEFFASLKENLKLFVGISDTSSEKSIDFVKSTLRNVKSAAIDAMVCTLPFYFSLPGKDQLSFFKKLAEAIEFPLILYNIPQLTNNQYILPEVIQELQNIPNIVGLKESSKNFIYFQNILSKIDNGKFKVYQGAEELMAASIVVKANGFVPGIANIIPEICSELLFTTDFNKINNIQKRILQYVELYNYAPWIVVLKVILNGMGIISTAKSVIFDEPDLDLRKRIIGEFSKIKESKSAV